MLLLALLGEADFLTGQVLCPRTPPDAIARFAGQLPGEDEEWVVEGVCAYVPQVKFILFRSDIFPSHIDYLVCNRVLG